ncbi:T-lymphocyte activation antigen CD86 [Stigmatopora nigra]
MRMAAIGILLWLLTAVCICGQNATFAFVKVDCKENIGRYNQPSMLDCMVSLTQVLKDLTVTTVVWKKDGELLLSFFEENVNAMKGYSFAVPSWNSKSLNVSLLIANTALSNHGIYTCLVVTDRGSDNSSARLNVTAKYNRPIMVSSPAKVTPNSIVNLTCRSEYGYPKGRLVWLVNQNVQKDIITVAEEMETGLYSLSSELTLRLGQDLTQIQCEVLTASHSKDDEVDVWMPDPSRFEGQAKNPESGLDVATKVVAPVVVIGSLVVGLLLYLVLKSKYRNSRPRQDNQPEIDTEQGGTLDNLLGTSESQETL